MIVFKVIINDECEHPASVGYEVLVGAAVNIVF
jgi:hypothetical protein